MTTQARIETLEQSLRYAHDELVEQAQNHRDVDQIEDAENCERAAEMIKQLIALLYELAY